MEGHTIGWPLNNRPDRPAAGRPGRDEFRKEIPAESSSDNLNKDLTGVPAACGNEASLRSF